MHLLLHRLQTPPATGKTDYQRMPEIDPITRRDADSEAHPTYDASSVKRI